MAKSVALPFALAVVWLVSSPVKAEDCALTRAQLLQEKHILSYENVNGLIDNWRWDKVPAGQSLRLLCAHSERSLKCEMNGTFDIPLPVEECSRPLKAKVEQIEDKTCPFKTYRVGYRVDWIDNFMELYRSCYDPRTMRNQYTQHKMVYHANSVNRPAQAFTTDSLITANEAASFSNARVHARFQELLGAQQNYIQSSNALLIDRGHLVPAADFIFPDAMRATFKYLNVVPQFAAINRGNWKSIETWARSQITPGMEVKVTTRTSGVLTLKDAQGKNVPMYLLNNNRNPIPKWLYKKLQFSDGRIYIFMTYNNIFSSRVPRPKCGVIDCPSSLNLNPSTNMGVTFCCDAKDAVRE